MSEVQSRPAASRGGRGPARGGRGSFGGRGGGRAPSRSHGANGEANPKADAEGSTLAAFEDDAEIARLKKLHGSKTAPIKEMFPDWSEVDILFALQETDGDQHLAVTRIAEGAISQWGEVSKQKKDKSRSKPKDSNFTTTGEATSTANARPSRGGRGSNDSGRGRGRAAERGSRAVTRARPTQTNGTRNKENQQLSVPTEESSTWDNDKPGGETTGWGDSTTAWDTAATSTETAPPTASERPANAASKTSIIPDGTRKTWASMLRQSTVPKPTPKVKDTVQTQSSEPVIEPLPPTEPAPAQAETTTTAGIGASTEEPPVSASKVVVPEVVLLPSKDQLTETNLEQVVDESHPPVTETAASEAADSWDPRTAVPISSTATPISASQHQHQPPRPGASGYATTAMKATDRATRTPSYQRRILDQEEAVRMPVNRDQVDRATVQFGAFNLNGLDDDIDGDREEPETRAQPPDDSPIAQPRASLPPAPQPSAPAQDIFGQSKAAPGLPPPSGTTAAPNLAASQHSATAQATAQLAQPQASQGQLGAQQYGRFGQTTAPEQSGFSQKPFDSLNQQSEAGYQTQQPPQAPGQQHSTSFSSAPSDYSSYYTADQQSRAPYNYYNQSYGQQQSSQAQQEGLPLQQQQQQQQQQQRSFGFNAPQSDNLSQYPQSGSQHGQSRYGTAAAAAEVQNSGNTTPNPSASQTQQTSGQANQSQAQGQQQQPADFPYSHPYYASAYYSTYMNQYPGGYNQGGYGGPYGKGGMYGQPHQYGMSPQGPYGHGSSPAAGFNQSPLHRADSGISSGLGEFGRAGSAQSGTQASLGGSGFSSSMHDTFGRGSSSYQSQSGQSFNTSSGQSGSGPSTNDDLKPFGDSKAGSGPSPSLSSAARPGSATNNAQSQSGLPPPQSNQQGGFGSSGYGGYPGHLQGHGVHGNQSGQGAYGMSGGSGQQGHGNSAYGSYGNQGFGSGSFYSQQQPRGWGGNYH